MPAITPRQEWGWVGMLCYQQEKPETEEVQDNEENTFWQSARSQFRRHRTNIHRPMFTTGPQDPEVAEKNSHKNMTKHGLSVYPDGDDQDHGVWW